MNETQFTKRKTDEIEAAISKGVDEMLDVQLVDNSIADARVAAVELRRIIREAVIAGFTIGVDK